MDGLNKIDNQWIPLQKKVFSRWVSTHLRGTSNSQIEDITKDLSNGVALCNLAEILTRKQVPFNWSHDPKRTVDMVQNCDLSLRMFENDGVCLIGISGKDINDNNEKLILGLVWSLILHYTIAQSISNENLDKNNNDSILVENNDKDISISSANLRISTLSSYPIGNKSSTNSGIIKSQNSISPKNQKLALLSWASDRIGEYPYIDGFQPYDMVLCALLDSYVPDKINYYDLDPKNIKYNMNLAASVMKELGIPTYVYPEEIENNGNAVDEKTLLTQLASAKFVLDKLQNFKKAPSTQITIVHQARTISASFASSSSVMFSDNINISNADQPRDADSYLISRSLDNDESDYASGEDNEEYENSKESEINDYYSQTENNDDKTVSSGKIEIPEIHSSTSDDGKKEINSEFTNLFINKSIDLEEEENKEQEPNNHADDLGDAEDNDTEETEQSSSAEVLVLHGNGKHEYRSVKKDSRKDNQIKEKKLNDDEKRNDIKNDDDELDDDLISDETFSDNDESNYSNKSDKNGSDDNDDSNGDSNINDDKETEKENGNSNKKQELDVSGNTNATNENENKVNELYTPEGNSNFTEQQDHPVVIKSGDLNYFEQTKPLIPPNDNEKENSKYVQTRSFNLDNTKPKKIIEMSPEDKFLTRDMSIRHIKILKDGEKNYYDEGLNWYVSVSGKEIPNEARTRDVQLDNEDRYLTRKMSLPHFKPPKADKKEATTDYTTCHMFDVKKKWW